MIIKFKDLWEDYYTNDLTFITTNSYIKTNGRLVMGAGAAKQALTRFPNIDKEFGERISHLEIYGTLVSSIYSIGAFQTKRHWRESSSYEIIKYSTRLLSEYASHNPNIKIGLNYPGIGLGNLDKDLVSSIIISLPDNVFIYQR